MSKKKGRLPTTMRKTTDISVFEDPYKLKGRVLGMMRKDFKKSPMYSMALKRAFLGKTVYQCTNEACDFKVYTGVSAKNFEALKEEYPNLIKGSLSKNIQTDHVDPIVPYDRTTKNMSLDELAPRVYCATENLACLCKACHKEKSSKESTIRKLYRAEKKAKGEDDAEK
jgi:hypothetical protein